MHRLAFLLLLSLTACSTAPDRCGTLNIRCCVANPSCGTGLSCNNGTCASSACGGEGQSCCSSASCNFASLQCRDGTCRAAGFDAALEDTSVDGARFDTSAAADTSDATTSNCASATNCTACVDPARACHWCNATGSCTSTNSACEFGLRRSADECRTSCDPPNTPCIAATDCCGANVCGFGICRAATQCAQDTSTCDSLGSGQGCRVCQVSGVSNGSSSLIYCVPQASTCSSSPQCCGFMQCVGGRCACRSQSEPCMNDDDCCGPHRPGRCVGATREQTGTCAAS